MSTQESLQQQLATQVDTNSAKAQSQQLELQRLTAELTKAKKQLGEAQHAVSATSDELKVGAILTVGGPDLLTPLGSRTRLMAWLNYGII